MVHFPSYLSITASGAAIIGGYYWFRWYRRHRDRNRLNKEIKDKNAEKKEHLSVNNIKEINDVLITKTVAKGNVKANAASPTASKSIKINGTISNEDENRTFGKSAPITIVQTGRGTQSPAKQSQVDSEELKSKIQDAEHKLLRSIDEDFENLSSPLDLPDTFDNRMPFYSCNVDIKKEEPVVVMATNTPKISPINSFLESKYQTKESEENNNLDDTKLVENGSGNVGSLEKSLKETTASTSVNTEEMIKNETSAITEDSKKQFIVNDTETETTELNEKRNVDAASPSLSMSSAQSGDSGKGSSLPHSEVARAKITYEFVLPHSLLSRFFGNKRSFTNFIKNATNATVVLRKNYYAKKLRVCAIEGVESEIKAALDLIRQSLPAERYPKLTLERIYFTVQQAVVPLSTESLLNLQLNLIEGINNDVVVSAIISGGHIFVQYPAHPSHPTLAILQKNMYDEYSRAEAPLLPGIELSAICVMSVNGVWYRVGIVDQDPEETDRCIVKFLDFGGYMNVHFNELRQIRSNFMSLPFQATECVLSDIEPIDGTCWSAESVEILSNLTSGIVLQAQVAGYNSQNIPEIYLFACLGPSKVIFINKELAARNLAKWVGKD